MDTQTNDRPDPEDEQVGDDGGGGPAPAKPKKAKAKKAKTAVKKSAAKAEKKAKGKKAKSGVPKGPEALKQYVTGYVKDKEKKTANGNVSVHCGDDVSKKLIGKPLDDVYKLVGKACEPDLNEKELRKKYGHLNVGMQRMNLGNRLRGVLNAK